jgi:hypothetical protein
MTANGTDRPIELIERYLDELYRELRGPARYARRVLAETETHLHDAFDARVAAGVEPLIAARDTVADFGPVRAYARSCNNVSAVDRVVALVPEVARPAVLLAGLACVAVGVSTLVCRVMVSAWGSAFVFADPPGTRYPAGACARWLSIHAGALTCTQAALAEKTADGLFQGYAVGVLGIAILTSYAWWSRRRSGRQPVAPLTWTVAAVGAGTAGVILTGFGVDRAAVFGAQGPGQWLASGAVCLAFGVGAAAMAVRTPIALRRPVPA